MLKKISPGIKSIIFAGLFFSVVNTLVKYLKPIPAVEVVFFRSIVSFIMSYVMIKKLNVKIFDKNNIILLLSRGLAGALALIMYFTTIQNIPLATAVTILYLAPIFTVIFAIFINGEKPHPMQFPFMILSLMGAFILKGIDSQIPLKYFIMGILSAIFAGLAYNIIRKLRGKADKHLIIFYFPLVTIPIVTPSVINNWVTPNYFEFLLLIAVGIFTQMAQIFMTRAYLTEEVSKIGHFNYLTSIYSIFIGLFLFNEEIEIKTIIGIFLIIIGVIYSTKFGERA